MCLSVGSSVSRITPEYVDRFWQNCFRGVAFVTSNNLLGFCDDADHNADVGIFKHNFSLLQNKGRCMN